MRREYDLSKGKRWSEVMKEMAVKRKVKWRRVRSARNSDSTVPMEYLDWTQWWTDTTFAPIYLHVPSKDDGTVHRVFPKVKFGSKVRLGLRHGEVYWVFSEGPE